MALQSINPATEESLAKYQLLEPGQAGALLQEAYDTAARWRATTYPERSTLLRRAGEVLRANAGRYAGLITAEMGKPIVEAEAEIEKCAGNCDYFAEHAAQFLADEPIASPARESYVAFEPLGVVLAIMPWNFPFWQVFRFAAPALMAGNTALLKHASNVTGCALAIEEVFRTAGFPPGVFRTLLLERAAVAELIADPRVAAVTLTGSDETGSQVAAAAGRALKKTVLELGGSDPFIVLADADLAGAAQVGARARFQNTGQSCIAAKRFIVVDAIADDFLQRFKAAAEALPVGDPTARTTRLGPLARADLRDNLERQLADSVQQGAQVVTGGERRAGKGYFYPPTIVTSVTSAMPVYREETFGPLAAVIRVRDVAEAIAVANDTPYGLGANLWTRDVTQAKTLARQIAAGSVFINGMVASNSRLPFGGIKRSGYGRELSAFGIREFTNIQTVWVEAGQAPQPPAE
ncbi:MAG: NAD-dependent succinate-semialdehyde dehydrogenase [Thermomicrobiales bacterium]